eukprot:TRINITY_DN2849_c0_g1_i1.p1 TRINITY_DN2849_c0_g1~~TRINITY_DN2849_c0_g1_i1.p1  ORF type:complete len:890 (-),score=181.40 TRINITY_DN2849_c0_g1_i1:42-2567(-)
MAGSVLATFYRFDETSARWERQTSKSVLIEHTNAASSSSSSSTASSTSTSKGVSLQKKSRVSTQRSSSSSSLLGNHNHELRYVTSRVTFDATTSLPCLYVLLFIKEDSTYIFGFIDKEELSFVRLGVFTKHQLLTPQLNKFQIHEGPSFSGWNSTTSSLILATLSSSGSWSVRSVSMPNTHQGDGALHDVVLACDDSHLVMATTSKKKKKEKKEQHRKEAILESSLWKMSMISTLPSTTDVTQIMDEMINDWQWNMVPLQAKSLTTDGSEEEIDLFESDSMDISNEDSSTVPKWDVPPSFAKITTCVLVVDNDFECGSSTHTNKEEEVAMYPKTTFLGTKYKQLLEFHNGDIARSQALFAVPYRIDLAGVSGGDSQLIVGYEKDNTVEVYSRRTLTRLNVYHNVAKVIVGEFLSNTGGQQTLLLFNNSDLDEFVLTDQERTFEHNKALDDGSKLQEAVSLESVLHGLGSRVQAGSREVELLKAKIKDKDILIAEGCGLLHQVSIGKPFESSSSLSEDLVPFHPDDERASNPLTEGEKVLVELTSVKHSLVDLLLRVWVTVKNISSKDTISSIGFLLSSNSVINGKSNTVSVDANRSAILCIETKLPSSFLELHLNVIVEYWVVNEEQKETNYDFAKRIVSSQTIELKATDLFSRSDTGQLPLYASSANVVLSSSSTNLIKLPELLSKKLPLKPKGDGASSGSVIVLETDTRGSSTSLSCKLELFCLFQYAECRIESADEAGVSVAIAALKSVLPSDVVIYSNLGSQEFLSFLDSFVRSISAETSFAIRWMKQLTSNPNSDVSALMEFVRFQMATDDSFARIQAEICSHSHCAALSTSNSIV